MQKRKSKSQILPEESCCVQTCIFYIILGRICLPYKRRSCMVLIILPLGSEHINTYRLHFLTMLFVFCSEFFSSFLSSGKFFKKEVFLTQGTCHGIFSIL